MTIRPSKIQPNQKEAPKPRIIPVDDYFRELLDKQCAKTPKSWPYVFPQFTNLCRVTAKILKLAGIEKVDVLGKRLWAHSFRHTFGMETHEKTGLVNTSQAMGHADISTTMIYAHNKLNIEPVDVRGILGVPKPEEDIKSEMFYG